MPHHEAVKRFRVILATLKCVSLAVKWPGTEMLKRLGNAAGETFYLIGTQATIMKTNYKTHCVRGLKMMLSTEKVSSINLVDVSRGYRPVMSLSLLTYGVMWRTENSTPMRFLPLIRYSFTCFSHC